MWHAAHAALFDPKCRSPTYVNPAIVDMNHKLFLMRRPSSRKDRLVKRTYDLCLKIVAIHFGIIWEFFDNMEAARVPYDREHVVAWNIISRLCDHVISRQRPHATWWYIEEKPPFIISHEVMLIISFGSIQEGRHDLLILHSFLAQSTINTCDT
jgi:hypothetical protein